MMLVPVKSREGTSTTPRPGVSARENLVDIVRRDQRDIRQNRANFSRARRDQHLGREPDRGIQPARIFLVDCDSSRLARERQQPWHPR